MSQWQARGLWSDKLTVAAALIAVGQARAATLADSYVVASLGGADATIVPDAFAGVASDGRPLNSLLVGAAVALLEPSARVGAHSDADLLPT